MDAPAKRRRWLVRAIVLLAILGVGANLWGAAAPSEARWDVGSAQTHELRDCRGGRFLHWIDFVELGAPPPPRLLPKIQWRLHGLQGERDGDLALAMDLVLNGVTVHQRIVETHYEAGKVGGGSGTMASDFDQMRAFPTQAGRNEVQLAVALTCKTPSAGGLDFDLELGPMRVVTQDSEPWMDW